jgi:ABC-2 type transport system ATP-binding protein
LSQRQENQLLVDSNKGVEVLAVSKALGGQAILDEVDLLVPSGNVGIIEGGNGSGKTTLIRILSTVISPDRGEARINGYRVTKDALKVRQSLGVSFASDRSLYWRVSGFQNLELFGRLRGMNNEAIRERSLALCRRLGLVDVCKEPVLKMSTGQRQRLMIARAMLADPPVVLLDEPFRGLDGEGVESVLRLISEISEAGNTALVVAPVIEPALEIANLVFRIENRKICPVQSGNAK